MPLPRGRRLGARRRSNGGQTVHFYRHGRSRSGFGRRCDGPAGVALGLGEVAAAAAPFAAPPLDPVRIGMVGVGLQGGTHLENFLTIAGCRIAAVCDVNPSRVAWATAAVTAAGHPAPAGRDARDVVRLWDHAATEVPTQGLGPLANCLDTNRGDRFDHMVSMSSPARGLAADRPRRGGPQRRGGAEHPVHQRAEPAGRVPDFTRGGWTTAPRLELGTD